MKKVRVAINGFGRIGRAFFKATWESDHIELIAINDLSNLDNLAYLLQYDSAYGKWGHRVEHEGDHLLVDGKEVRFVNKADPAQLPWADLDVDVAVEATGVFTDYSKASAHLDAGAKRIVISAPAKGEAPSGVKTATVLMGVNEGELASCQMTSNGSCTTNAASPVMQILGESLKAIVRAWGLLWARCLVTLS